MERLTDCAQGYCEMYCKKYGHCFGDPGDCIFKEEIKLYDAVKSIEGIVPFDRLLELADADRAGQLVVLPCKVGDTVFKPVVTDEGLKCVWPISIHNFSLEIGGFYLESYAIGETENGSGIRIGIDDFGKTVFLTREEAEAALKGDNGHA